jgi:VanZ family protein
VRLARLWGPVALWLALTIATSSQSDVGSLGRIPDWVTHGIEYGVLGTLVCRALAGGFGRALSVRQALLAVSLCVAWGVSDEWHQSFVPERDASAWDVAKDFAGATLAASAWRAFSAQDDKPGEPGV